jgi:hypothetical protein
MFEGYSLLKGCDMKKKTLTLNLTEEEMQVLESLAQRKEVSKTAIIRLSLRLYQMIDYRLGKGQKVFVEDDVKQEKTELLLI